MLKSVPIAADALGPYISNLSAVKALAMQDYFLKGGFQQPEPLSVKKWNIEFFIKTNSAVWYKTKFGSQILATNFWCLLCNICNVFKNVFNVGLMIILQSIVVGGFPTTEIRALDNLEVYQLW